MVEHRTIEQDSCPAEIQHGGSLWLCTLDKGHLGRHEAWGINKLHHAWEPLSSKSKSPQGERPSGDYEQAEAIEPQGSRSESPAHLSSKNQVSRWVTTWPYDLQPTFGSSTIDWTKVEVVPAAAYDALEAERDRLAAEVSRMTTDCVRDWGNLRHGYERLRAALNDISIDEFTADFVAGGEAWQEDYWRVVNIARKALSGAADETTAALKASTAVSGTPNGEFGTDTAEVIDIDTCPVCKGKGCD